MREYRYDMNERVIVTERLTLRPPVVDDAEGVVAAYTSDPDVTKYLLFLPYDDVGLARAFLQAKVDEMAEGRSVYWLIVSKAEHQVIGAIDLRFHDESGDVGYVLGKRWWGQGIVPEALRAVMDYARGRLALRRITGMCDVDNVQSARVFEKCGFYRTGIENDVIIHPALGPDPRPVIRFAIDL